MLRPRVNLEVAGVALAFTVFYSGAGILVPYFPLWLADRGFDAADISFVLSAPLILRALAAPAFGYVGDRYGQRRVVRITTAICLAAAAALPLAPPFWPIMLLAGIVYVCWQSSPLQLDSIAIGLVRRNLVVSYGSIRAFGSSAFVTANVAGGLVLGAWGSSGILACFLTLTAALLLCTFALAAAADKVEARDTPPPASVWRQPALIGVMVAAALVQSAHASFMSFGAIHMKDLGYPDGLIGVVLGTATFAEVLMFAVGGRFVARVQPLHLIVLGGAVAIVRWTAVAFVTAPALMFVLQLSHAVTFGCTYLGLIGFIVKSVDARQVVSAQGIYVAMFGAFNALLTLAIGATYDAWGGHSFLISACLPALALLLLAARGAVLRAR